MAEEEKIKKMAKFRTILEKRVHEMESELEGLRAVLEFVDDMLLEEGFKRVKIDESAFPESQASEKPENLISIKTVNGVLLANFFIKEDSIHIITAKERQFNVNTSPFTSFFVERVLMKMREKDQEAMRKGEITSEQMLTYNILRDGDFLREIIIRNTTPERIRELKSTVRWTLEKMYEKTADV